MKFIQVRNGTSSIVLPGISSTSIPVIVPVYCTTRRVPTDLAPRVKVRPPEMIIRVLFVHHTSLGSDIHLSAQPQSWDSESVSELSGSFVMRQLIGNGAPPPVRLPRTSLEFPLLTQVKR